MLEPVLDDPPHDLAADISELALKVAYAGFASVGADDLHDSLVGEDDILLAQAGGFALLLHQILLGNLELLSLGVAMQPQNLHAILQRAGDSVQHVRGGHEQDLRQVVFHVEVVILEAGVLLGVQHFQQSRCRIAAEVRGHLIHFVQHEHGIACAGFLHGLDDLPRQARQCTYGDDRESQLRRALRPATCAQTCAR